MREFGNTYSKANKKGGKKKEAFFLDLTGPAPADMEKKMSTSKASITLASVKGAKVCSCVCGGGCTGRLAIFGGRHSIYMNM